jgi:hypothetical protein
MEHNNHEEPEKKFLEDMAWDQKAQTNPLYAVMSSPEFACSSSTFREDELEGFFAEEEKKVCAWVLPWLQEEPAYK